ncbi:hypothetical protein GCM10007933_15230 [Zoogloea oryzae]|uniref:Uncharacterized protein n=1 Tax=Zoogloea oryzae TaxID=310767 RepID=A0ABQ6FA01_9RHOO|nr:hypothetical protein GCM10007933_15230 [Zoogloea oryzae]
MGNRYVGNQYSNTLACALAHGLNKPSGNRKIFIGGNNNAFWNQQNALPHCGAGGTLINGPDGAHWITM